MVEFGRVPVKRRIGASIAKMFEVGTGKGSNQCERRKMEESVRVSKNCSRMSTRKGSNEWEYRKMVEFVRVPGKVESVRVSKNCPGDYKKMVESI